MANGKGHKRSREKELLSAFREKTVESASTKITRVKILAAILKEIVQLPVILSLKSL
jgi:hypothetical protein